jgi:uncharacterized protein YbaR (Trm112 family)
LLSILLRGKAIGAPQGSARNPRLPEVRGDIRLNEAGDGLICDNCRLLHEIRDDIPIMLIDEAKKLD